MLPFTHQQFLDLFASYNLSVWPMQVVAYALAAAMLLALRRTPSRLPGLGLAAMWIWTGVAYHWMQFARINPAAWAFGALFVAQGLMLAAATLRRRPVAFSAGWGLAGLLGWALLGYSTLVYPMLGLAAGQRYIELPTFGITPCPVTLFTFGLLLLARTRVPVSLLVIPVAWSLVGGSAAVLLQMPQDWVLLVAGLAVLPILRAHRGSAAHAADWVIHPAVPSRGTGSRVR